MYQSVNFYDFEQAFRRADRAENFSYKGLRALFEWFEDLEEDTGEEIELDVISICCDFSEYSSATEAVGELSSDTIEGDDDDEIEELSLEYLRDRTAVIEFCGGIIVQSF